MGKGTGLMFSERPGWAAAEKAGGKDWLYKPYYG